MKTKREEKQNSVHDGYLYRIMWVILVKEPQESTKG